MIAAAAVLAATFNLVCSGTVETSDASGTRSEPYSVTYRFDLNRKVYCEGDCPAALPMKDVQPALLLLGERRIDSASETIRYRNAIDRVSGRQTILDQRQRTGDARSAVAKRTDAMCEPAAFTGLPGTPVSAATKPF